MGRVEFGGGWNSGEGGIRDSEMSGFFVDLGHFNDFIHYRLFDRNGFMWGFEPGSPLKYAHLYHHSAGDKIFASRSKCPDVHVLMHRMDGALWLSGKFGALHLECRRFEPHSSCYVWTLGKPFTRSCLTT